MRCSRGLFADAPDASLLARHCRRAGAGARRARWRRAGANGMAEAWDALRAASAAMAPEAARDEFQTLFVGVGRSEVSLYASHYLGPQSGRPLGRTSRVAGQARPRPAPGIQRIRGSPVAGAGNHAHAGRGRRRAAPGGDRRAAGFFRSPCAAVDRRLLQCNIHEFCCQLLPAGSTIRTMFRGART